MVANQHNNNAEISFFTVAFLVERIVDFRILTALYCTTKLSRWLGHKTGHKT
jgi:hypothetical protein